MEPEKKKTRTCAVCKLCQEVPEANKIVHEDKFHEVLTLPDVMQRLETATGKKLSIFQLSNHYSKHLGKINPLLEIEYKKQATMLKSPKRFEDKVKEYREGLGTEKAVVKSATNFDAIGKLKELFVDLNSRMAEFQRKNGTELTKETLVTYKDMVEELRKIAYDIARVELDRSYLSKVLLGVYRDVATDVIQKIADGMRESFGRLDLNEQQKKEVADGVRDTTSFALISGLEKLERELSSRL